MTTREIYFKILMSTELPVGHAQFTFKKNGIIKLGNSIVLEFKSENLNLNLNKMKNLEESEGFMFWNMSPEGETFFHENKNEISNLIFLELF